MNEDCQLYLDTTSNLSTTVKLGGIELKETYATPRQQRVLELVEKVLKKKGKNIEDIRGIEINRGPGSFTGLRVGCTIANALRWFLKTGNPIEPIYEEDLKKGTT